jgi:hypothetical protein
MLFIIVFATGLNKIAGQKRNKNVKYQSVQILPKFWVSSGQGQTRWGLGERWIQKC